jgi:hypothetical protein
MSFEVASYQNLTRLVFVVLLSIFAAGAVMAQRAPAGVGPPPNNNPNIGDRQRQIDESRLRSAEMGVGENEANQKRLQAAIANMKEDFRRIQVLRNDIARNLLAHKPFDYNLLAQQTAEINHRTSRLGIYMRARSTDEKPEDKTPDIKSADITEALVSLCQLIDRFTENPALKNAATVDSKDVAKNKEDKANADRDLLAIIKLSSSLQKESEKLKTPE